MNAIIQCMLERRSIRKYKISQITDDELNVILEAGLFAPCAGGRQSPIIVVSQNAAVNNELGKINRSTFKGKVSTANVSVDQPSIADDAGLPSAFYGAPTVLTLFAPKIFGYSAADCYIAAQNCMLAAHSLGIGSCMVGRAEETFSSELGQKLQKEWGIDDTYEAKIHVALGYPEGEYPEAKPRKENRILRI